MGLEVGFVIIVISVIIGYFINDWYNKVTKRVRLLETQVYLLNKIAEKIGVDKNDLYASEEILKGITKIN